MDQLVNLPDDCLLAMMKRLPREELFKLKRINRRMRELVDIELRTRIKAIFILSSIKSKWTFSKCRNHLGNITSEQVLVLRPTFGDLIDSTSKATFLSFLAKLTGVKSINFGCFKLPNEVYFAIVGCFPELECIMLDDPDVKQDEWSRILDRVGPKLVHFLGSRYDFVLDESQLSLARTDGRMVMMVAAKCPNIKKINWATDWRLNESLITAFGTMPRSCCVSIRCQTVDERTILEEVDELSVAKLDWPMLGNRVERLSSLKFLEMKHSDGLIHGVEFVNLKKLILGRYLINPKSIESLYECQFPRLEEFGFEAIKFTGQQYHTLFQLMTTVKKLTIDYALRFEQRQPNLPRASIRELNNLEEITVVISYVPTRNREWNVLFERIEMYVREVPSLKKLTFDDRYCDNSEWKRKVKNQVKRLKRIVQNRVQVELRPKTFNLVK